MVIPWDLVVIDEAHRLRNVYRPDNRIGKALKGALANAPKVLLTATPPAEHAHGTLWACQPHR
jgi:hypothetical protein